MSAAPTLPPTIHDAVFAEPRSMRAQWAFSFPNTSTCFAEWDMSVTANPGGLVQLEGKREPMDEDPENPSVEFAITLQHDELTALAHMLSVMAARLKKKNARDVWQDYPEEFAWSEEMAHR